MERILPCRRNLVSHRATVSVLHHDPTGGFFTLFTKVQNRCPSLTSYGFRGRSEVPGTVRLLSFLVSTSKCVGVNVGLGTDLQDCSRRPVLEG